MSDIICYHGTDKKTAELIANQGFKPRTYFAKHLEDALFYGGEYIFEVAFERGNIPYKWQFTTKERVNSDRIVGSYYLKIKNRYDNKELREEIFNYNLFSKGG